MERLDRKEIDYIISYIGRLFIVISLTIGISKFYLLQRDNDWPSLSLEESLAFFNYKPVIVPWESIQFVLNWLYELQLSTYTIAIALLCFAISRRV